MRPERKIKHQRSDRRAPKPTVQVTSGEKCEPTAVDQCLPEDPLANYKLLVNPQINDRVVWLGNDHIYQRATIKWLGTLPDDGKAKVGEPLVGVEFVSMLSCPLDTSATFLYCDIVISKCFLLAR